MALLVISVVASSNLPAQQKHPQAGYETTALTGRVLAYVDSMVIGVGVGPHYEKFIFGVESKREDGQPLITPVEIVYAFHKSDGLLPLSFFDHAKLYELRVVRDQNCDAKVSALSYEKNEDSTGKPLPPTYILRVMEGAPKDLLNTESKLPCYMLRPGVYRARA
jgi:hypothetical protein